MKLTSIVLLAMAVALAISIGIPDGMSRAQSGNEADVGITLLEIVGAEGEPPTITTLIASDAAELTIVKKERITQSVPVGKMLHFQWFPPPGMTWHCDRTKVPAEHGDNVECTVSVIGSPESRVQDANTKFFGVFACVRQIVTSPNLGCQQIAKALDHWKGAGANAEEQKKLGWETSRKFVLDGVAGNPSAVEANIIAALDALKPGGGAADKPKPGDELMFLINSHAQCASVDDTNDDDPGDDEAAVGAFGQNITDDELATMLSGFPASMTLTVVVDTCFAGGFVDGTSDLLSITDADGKKLTPGHIEVLMAGKVDEITWFEQFDGAGNVLDPTDPAGLNYTKGLFTHEIEKCLADDGTGKAKADTNPKDGVTTSKELFDCAKPPTEARAKVIADLFPPDSKTHHPQFKDNREDDTAPPCPIVPPFKFDHKVDKCTRIVPNSTRVVTSAPILPAKINTCNITEGPGGHGETYTIKDCDLDYEKTLPAGTPEDSSDPSGPNFEQAQPWHNEVKDSRPGSHQITECVTIQPEVPFVDPNQDNNSSCITFVIKLERTVSGVTSFINTGTGISVWAWTALGGSAAAGLFMVVATGWYAKRRWLGGVS